MKTDKLLEKLQSTIGFTPKAKDFTQILNFSNEQSFYSRVKRNSDFSDEEIEKIEEHYGISLRGGDNNSVELNYYPDVFASCGTGCTVFQESPEKISISKDSIPDYSPNAEYSVINASGSSMYPIIFEGDKIILKHWQGEQIIDDKIYLFTYNYELFIKKLVKNIDQIIIKSENKEYENRIITPNESFKIIGRVIGLIRTNV